MKEETSGSGRIGALPSHLARIYKDDTSWLEAMAVHTPVFFSGFAELCSEVLSEGAIPARIKELILGVVYATQGYSEGAAIHIKNARSAGVTTEEITEMIAAALLSRGVRAYTEGYKALLAAGIDERSPKTSGVAEAQGKEAPVTDIVEYFDRYYGKSLPHVRVLAEGGYGNVLRGYYIMRTEALKDAALPRKYKEFLYLAINATDLYPEAVRVHARGAMDYGATKEEILEAMLIAIVPKGVVAWFDAAKVYEEL